MASCLNVVAFSMIFIFTLLLKSIWSPCREMQLVYVNIL